MDQNLALLSLVLMLSTKQHAEQQPNSNVPAASFSDQMLALLNHDILVYTPNSIGFAGILTAVNSDYITVSANDPLGQTAYIPLQMVSAVIVSGS